MSKTTKKPLKEKASIQIDGSGSVTQNGEIVVKVDRPPGNNTVPSVQITIIGNVEHLTLSGMGTTTIEGDVGSLVNSGMPKVTINGSVARQSQPEPTIILTSYSSPFQPFLFTTPSSSTSSIRNIRNPAQTPRTPTAPVNSNNNRRLNPQPSSSSTALVCIENSIVADGAIAVQNVNQGGIGLSISSFFTEANNKKRQRK